jgi:hypothetical protein
MEKLMRRKYSLLIITIILSLAGIFAFKAVNSHDKIQTGDDFRKINNKAFTVGEVLRFDVKYGFVTAGIASYSIPEIKKMSGRDCYHILFEVNTVPTFDWIFKVRDRYETYLDVDGLFPWRFEQHVREGKFSIDFSAFFDQRKCKAKTTKGTFDIPKYVNDVVSAFYYARTLDLSKMQKGDKIHLQNFFDDKTYDLDVVFLGRERITISEGTWDCIIIEPLVKEGGLFKSEGSVTIWLSDDDLKIPVKVVTKVVIGSINAELTGYDGLISQPKAKVK